MPDANFTVNRFVNRLYRPVAVKRVCISRQNKSVLLLASISFTGMQKSRASFLNFREVRSLRHSYRVVG